MFQTDAKTDGWMDDQCVCLGRGGGGGGGGGGRGIIGWLDILHADYSHEINAKSQFENAVCCKY